MVLFTLGTGIGGGVIVAGDQGGHIIEGEHSHGAEVGHIKIEMTNPRKCGCGRLGCLEAYASATAVALRAREALGADGGRSSLHAVLRSGNELTSRDVFDAAAAGDELAGRIVEETAYYLAIGAMNLMHTIDPDLVVFGGGMTAAGDGFLDRIRAHVRQLAFPVPAERTRIVYAQLGSDAGFIGAAACGRRLVRR
jgi:glucokinase